MSWSTDIAAPVGGLLGGIFGNRSAAKEAQKNRNWQEYMSNTAHTREVADLRNAGLNPILSATGGSGASTPSGATASQQNPASSFGSDLNSARSLKIAAQQTAVAKQNADTAEMQAETEKYKADQLNRQNIFGRKLALDQLAIETKKLKNMTNLSDGQIAMYLKTGDAALITAGAHSSRAQSDILLNAEKARLTAIEAGLVKEKTKTEEYAKEKQRAEANVWRLGADATDYFFGRGGNYSGYHQKPSPNRNYGDNYGRVTD